MTGSPGRRMRRRSLLLVLVIAVPLSGCFDTQRSGAIDRGVDALSLSRFGRVVYDKRYGGGIGNPVQRHLGVVLRPGALGPDGVDVEESFAPYLRKAGFHSDPPNWRRGTGRSSISVQVSMVSAGRPFSASDGPTVPQGKTGLNLNFVGS